MITVSVVRCIRTVPTDMVTFHEPHNLQPYGMDMVRRLAFTDRILWVVLTIYGCSQIVMVMPLFLGAGGEIVHWVFD